MNLNNDNKKQIITAPLTETGLGFLIISMPFAYGAVRPVPLAVFEIVSVLLFFFRSIKVLTEKRLSITLSPILLLIPCFLIYGLLQLYAPRLRPFHSIYPWATKTELFKMISYSMIFLVTLTTVKTRKQIVKILYFIIGMGFLMSLFYLARYFGLNMPRGFINPDHFAAYLGMIIPVTFGLIFVQYVAGEGQKLFHEKQTMLFFALITMITALFFTMSRGGMFSFIGATILMSALLFKRRSFKKMRMIIAILMACVLGTIIWLGATPVVERLASVKAEVTSMYIGGRLPIWKGTLGIIKEFPLFGSGLGTFNYIFPKYQPAEIIIRHFTYAHSDFLELLSETGIIFFSIVIAVFSAFIIRSIKLFKCRHDPWVVGLSIGCFGSMTSIFIHSFVDFSLRIPATAVLFTLIAALSITILNLRHTNSRNRHYEAQNDEDVIPSDFCEAEESRDLLTTKHTQPVPDAAISTITINIPNFLRPLLFIISISLTGFLAFVYAKPAVADHYANQNTTIALKKAITFDPENAVYHYRLGNLYGKQKDTLSEAISEYKKAIELNPTNSKYHQSLAWTSSQLAPPSSLNLPDVIPSEGAAATEPRDLHPSPYIQAIHREFQTAINLNPNNPYRYRTYAMWLFNNPTNENIEKGVKVYRKAVELNPTLAEEAINRYYRHQKDHKKLVNILPGTNETDYVIFDFIRKKEGFEKAAKFSEKQLKTYPNNAKIHFSIADDSVYDNSYSWDFAERHYAIVFKNDPDNGFYRLHHGVHLAFNGYYEEALKDLEMSLKMGIGPVDEETAKKYITKCSKTIERKEWKK